VNQRRQHVADLERSSTEAEAKLRRLYEAIENGIIGIGDPSLKDRIAELTAMRDQARGDADRALVHIEKIGPAITPETLRAFAIATRKKLRNGDGSFARDHVRAVAQRIEVVSRNEVRIRGPRSELLRTLTATSGVEAAVLGVRSFETKWRPRRDSNSRPAV
jgi:site-specific DNA recombinase